MQGMRIEATERSRAVIERSKDARAGTLTITIGTGCCESTAPFLYEDFWPGPDQEAIGEVAGVQVFAPDYLRALYPDDETVVLDVIDEMAESLSIETEYGCRLVLRGEHTDSEGTAEVCDVEPARPAASREVVGELPEALRGLRIR
jgi:uncharacterized protein (DUF779 family)